MTLESALEIRKEGMAILIEQNKLLAEAVVAFNSVGCSHEIITVCEKHAPAIQLAAQIMGEK